MHSDLAEPKMKGFHFKSYSTIYLSYFATTLYPALPPRPLCNNRSQKASKYKRASGSCIHLITLPSMKYGSLNLNHDPLLTVEPHRHSSAVISNASKHCFEQEGFNLAPSQKRQRLYILLPPTLSQEESTL